MVGLPSFSDAKPGEWEVVRGSIKTDLTMSQWCRLFWRTSRWLSGAPICGTNWRFWGVKSDETEIIVRSSSIRLMISDWNCAICAIHVRLGRHLTKSFMTRKGRWRSAFHPQVDQSEASEGFQHSWVFHGISSLRSVIGWLVSKMFELHPSFQHLQALLGSWAVGKPGRDVPPPVDPVSRTDRGVGLGALGTAMSSNLWAEWNHMNLWDLLLGLPSGKHTKSIKKLLKMAIYSGFSHGKWWFSIVMLVYQRVFDDKWCYLRDLWLDQASQL